jgi:lipoprotein NlpI
MIFLARARLGERKAAAEELADHLAKRRAQKVDAWYVSMALFLSDQLSEADFLAAAPSDDPKTDRGHKCEAYFYAGSRRLVDGDPTKAREYFQRSLDTGMTSFMEYTSSRAALRAMGPGK